MRKRRVIIMGAAGRDFHNFNTVLRESPAFQVVAFTASQIPNIEGRRYPSELAGKAYPEGIPIRPADELEALIREHEVDQVIFAYSDVSHEHVMEQASRAMAAGAGFRILGPDATMLQASKPVVSICAVRTGCGKSPAARKVAGILRGRGFRVAVIRHPMPYGDLVKQTVQRFETLDDLKAADCTLEEMEDYEPHVTNGDVVFAGVDYEKILRKAEFEADVLVWDGGNNDFPFVKPDLEIVLIDPHRCGHERTYFPGRVNLLRADVVVFTKLDTADVQDTALVRRSVMELNPRAVMVDSAMPVSVFDSENIRGKRVLVIEDGPTVTHGGMPFGAGVLAAQKYGAAGLVDPRPFAVGSIREVYEKFNHIGKALPAMGYGDEQIRELEETIEKSDCDSVIIATPVNLLRCLKINRPTARVLYDLEEIGKPTLEEVLEELIRKVEACRKESSSRSAATR